jgi:2-dehydro-3-deoxygluconokinase
MSRVVTFGEMLMRLSPPGCERLFQSPAFGIAFGGAEANVAVSLAHFGIESSYVTRLPGNAIGDAAIRALRAEGVHTDHVLRGGERMGIYFVETGAGQRPSTVVYDRQHSAIATIDPSSIPWERVLRGTKWLHVSGITPALGTGPAACMAHAIGAAKRAGITVSLDLNYRQLLWSANDAAAALRPLVATVDMLIANEEHLQTILGIEMVPVRASDNRAAYEDAARRTAIMYGLTRVALTLRDGRSANRSGWGAVLLDSASDTFVEGPRHDIEVVDRVGAGDAFTAGLIFGIVSGRTPEAALRFALAAGALKHTIPGDFNRVSAEDVDRLAGGTGSGRMVR